MRSFAHPMVWLMTFAVRISKGFKAKALVALAVTGTAIQVSAAPLPDYDAKLVTATSLTLQTLDANLAAPVDRVAAEPSARELECMAKVVHHEAANQSREGQLAVAQLMMNRMESGRFADTICGVAAQRGQFFDVDSYSPRQDARWDTALDVSREALAEAGRAVVPGALFYHAATQPATTFFRTRHRVAQLGDHIFYR